MSLTIGQVARVFRTYQTQERIGQLNRESGYRTVQGQVDIVDISERARQLLDEDNRSTGKGPEDAPLPAKESAAPPANPEKPFVEPETASNTSETAPLPGESEPTFAGT